MRSPSAGAKTEGSVSCGNDGAVESVESQKQAAHSFHEPLGNLAKSRRDSHIPTAPATRAMEKWKTKGRFPTRRRAGYRSPPAAAFCAAVATTSTDSVTFSGEATRPERIVDAGQLQD